MRSHKFTSFWFWPGLGAVTLVGFLGLAIPCGKQRILRSRLVALEGQERALRAAPTSSQRAQGASQGRSPVLSPKSKEAEPASSLSADSPLVWVTAEQLGNAGRATPLAAFQTLLWAAGQQNVDALAAMVELSDRDRNLAETYLAQLPPGRQTEYGTPERLFALMLVHNAPAAFQLYSIAPDGGRGQLTVSGLAQNSDGTPYFAGYTFHQTPSGWMATGGAPWYPGARMSSYIQYLSGGAVSPRPPVATVKDAPPPTLPEPN